MRTRSGLVTAVMGLVLFASAARAADSTIGEPLAGTLPNGLSYVVAPHVSPAKDISVHLVVQCGSLDEQDNERGFAHFVEHLAFSGTRNYPPSAIRVLFQRLGSTIGPDINANTGYSHTRYFFNVSGEDPGKLNEALGVLRDFADGITFSAEEILREAEVVDNETRTRDTADNRFSQQFLHALYQGTSIPQRDVLGPLGVLRSASPAQVRAFYERNYRAQRMTVVVAGAIDGQAVVRRIAELFGNVPAGGERLRPAVVPPTLAGPRATVLRPKVAGAAVVNFVGISTRPPDTPEGRREALIERLAVSALNERFRAANLTPRAYVVPGPADALVQCGLSVVLERRLWESAVGFGEAALRRAATEGFSEAEIGRMMEEEIRQHRAKSAAIASEAAQIGAEIAQAVIEGRAWQTPEARLADLTRTPIAPAELKSAIVKLFAPKSLGIVVVAPPVNAPGKESQVIKTFNRASRRSLGKSEKNDDVTFAYLDFGTAGTVANRQVVEDLGLTLVSFQNGVQLNVRTSTTEPEQFRLRIIFPEGIAHLDKDGAGVPQVAGYIFTSATPSRHTPPEIAALFTEHDLTMRLVVAGGTPILDLSGPSESLNFALSWLTAMFSDLRIEDHDRNWALGRFRGDLQRIGGSEVELAQWESLRVFSGNDPRFSTRISGDWPGLASRAAGWVTHHMLKGPLEIGLVGDVSAEDAIALAAKTVGTLKKREAPAKLRAPLVGPKKADRQETPAISENQTAVSRILWPVSLPETAKTDAALAVAADVLRDRLMLVLRESLGATYVAQTNFQRDVTQRDFAFLSMTSTFHPEKVRQLTLGCIQLAAQLAQRGILPEEFARLREPLRVRIASNLRENTWWVENVLPVAQRRPGVVEFARHYEHAAAELTPADVNAALQTLQPDRSIALITRPTAKK